uniref:Deoxyribonuclease II n=1 Tax=Panagrolaimus sp. ES5 TaxID=591445 RepID=A0AC34GRW7_9BILA
MSKGGTKKPHRDNTQSIIKPTIRRRARRHPLPPPPTAILSLFFLSATSFDFDCLDLNGQSVDWFAAYKLPILSDRSKHRSGLDFLYADARQPESWQVSTKQINDSSSAIGKTMGQLWKAKNDQSIFYALYNDEHPGSNKSDSYRGHMKGVLLFDDFRGFWLIHSVPNYVDLSKSAYSYPSSGVRNGQSFLCVTFPVSALSQIGTQLLFSQPSVYDYRLPDSFKKLFPDLTKAIEKKSMSRAEASFSSIKSIKSLDGVNFMSFSKHKKYGKDLYGDLVAPELKSSFYVETWLNGPVDVDYAFSSSKDHSKWAVSDNGNLPYVCIGDINRQKSQMGRGGGTLCIQNFLLWHLYRSSVDHVECCPTSNIFHFPAFHNSVSTLRSNVGVSHFSCLILFFFGFFNLMIS